MKVFQMLFSHEKDQRACPLFCEGKIDYMAKQYRFNWSLKKDKGQIQRHIPSDSV